MSLLSVQKLQIQLGEFSLQGASLEVEQGEYVNIIGPTGAGKSILLECIIGYYFPARGRIYLEGADITRALPEKRRIGIVYQDYALLPHMSVYGNIAFGLKKHMKTGIRQKVDAMAELLHITHLLHRHPGTLSGGEQQRTALARALVVQPKLLLMDEPFSALDPTTKKEIRSMMHSVIQTQDTTIVHVTHDLEDVWSLADTVGIMHQGRMLQFGAREDLFNKPGSRFVADFVGASLYEAHVCDTCASGCRLDVNGCTLQCMDQTADGSRVQVALRPEHIMLSREAPLSENGLNVLRAEVESIVPEGQLYTIHLRSNGLNLEVKSTLNSLTQLAPKSGENLFACIDPEHLRIVGPAPPAHSH